MNGSLKSIFMNKSLLISTAVSVAAATLLYMLKRKMGPARAITENVVEHGRHLTNVFAKAKHN